MRILNIKIKDFRNIVRADINFEKINILTGKNSSGKSNFLLALSQSLSKERDYSEIFSSNVVTFRPGKDYATIGTRIGGVNTEACYLQDKKFFCISPQEFYFEKEINKKAFSKVHKVYFTGRYFDSEKSNGITWSEFRKKRDEFYLKSEHHLVYEEKFFKEIQEDITKVVQLSKKQLPHQEEYLISLNDLNRSLVSWVEKTDEIHRFVTEKGDREIFDQVVERLKKRSIKQGSSLRRTLFSKAKFIFLLADLQSSEKQYINFKNDLKIYTKGIVTNIFINKRGNNKGEINIDSPNGPKDIWTISHGTSILLFFILLLNWVRIPEHQKSYISPKVMIFDEIDSLVHPGLMSEFKEVLRSLSEEVQLFMSSHSPYFIDGFEKKEIFLLKDTSSIPDAKRIFANRCNIYDYEKIISLLPAKDRKVFSEMKNSELFVNGFIDQIFPAKEYD